MLRWIHILIPILVVIAAVGLRVYDPPLISDVRLRVFDLYQRIHPRPYVPVPVRVIDIDHESLKRHGQWPWPRTVFAKLIDGLTEAGAAVIALDMVMAEPDRTSPARVIEHWSVGPAFEAMRSDIEDLPDHDEILAEHIARAPVITGFILSGTASDIPPGRKAQFVHLGDDPRMFLPPFEGAVDNLAVFTEAATGIGAVNVIVDGDAFVRRVPLILSMNGEMYPSLSAEALRVAFGSPTYVVKSSGGSGQLSFGEHTGITHVKIADLVIPTDKGGEVWLYQSLPEAERVVPAWKILEGVFDPNQIAGSIIFVGTSAAGLFDLRATALAPNVPGVELHAQAVEQILTQTYLYRPDWLEGAEMIGLVLAGIMIISVVGRMGAAMGLAISLLSIVGGCVISWQLFLEYQMLVAPVYPSLVIALVYMSASVSQYMVSENERRQVRFAFGRYMSPVLLDRLTGNLEDLKLGGEIRQMSVMFCDIRNFSGIAEGMDAESLTRLINRCLTPLTHSIQNHKGLIDKYIGDAVMAFWNAPLDDADHVQNACEASLDMLISLEALNAELSAEAETAGQPFQEIRVGIGIGTGLCCVGNLGSDQRFDYSVMGDTVNVASRLEAQTKTYGVPIILNDTARRASKALATIELDLVRVKGRQTPETIHALLGGPDVAMGAEFQDLAAIYARMLGAYRASQWSDATEALNKARFLAPKFGLGPLLDIYEDRLKTFASQPPESGWDGVFIQSIRS